MPPTVRASTRRASLSRVDGGCENRIFGGIEWSFADKHDWARRGVLVAHAGFVIIAAGTTLYWARGFDGEVALLDGQSTTIPQTGRASFGSTTSRTASHPTQTKSGMVYQPIDYVSRVTVSGKDGILKTLDRAREPSDRYRRYALLPGELWLRNAVLA